MTNELIDRAILLLKDSPQIDFRISKATGIHPTTISKYRNGITKPTPANARLLINYLTDEESQQLSAGPDSFYQKVIASQQETIRNLSETIKNLTSKND